MQAATPALTSGEASETADGARVRAGGTGREREPTHLPSAHTRPAHATPPLWPGGALAAVALGLGLAPRRGRGGRARPPFRAFVF